MANDPNGYPMTFAAVNLPVGLNINSSTGLISGTVDYSAAEEFGGSYATTVIVANNHGGSTPVNFTWTITDTDRAPVLTNPGNQTNAWNDSVSLQLSASDPDGDQLFYDATGLPPGLTIDGSSGLISGTVDPSAVAGIPYSVTATATDQTWTASQTFTWTITTTNHAPVLTSPGNQTNAAGDVVSLPVTATDADNNTLTYTATGLPTGLTIDPASGLISGTIASSAASSTPYNVTVTASDGMASASQSFTWTVNFVGVVNPGNQSNVIGDVVSLQITGSAISGSPSYGATGLPPNLNINSTGLIYGTISTTADASSPYTTTVTATSGPNSASQTFTWTVAHLALANPGNQINRDGDAVSLQSTATAPAPGAVVYSATGLPAGLNLNSSTGLISGNVGMAAHGNSPYQTTVTATQGTFSASQTFTWTVTPRVALVNPGPQGNAAGATVSLQVQATALAGGTLMYNATGLPSGLNISSSTGLISGTISTSAASSTPYAVTVTANDGSSTSSQTFYWTVSTLYLAQPADQTNLDADTVSLSLGAQYYGAGNILYGATGLPNGLSINSSTGVISGTVANTADTNSPYIVTVTATAGSTTASQTFTWTVNPRVSVYSPDDQTNAVGDVVSLSIAAGDAGSGTLMYSASGLPSGLGINSSTGVITGTIALGADSSSPYSVTVTAADAVLSNSATFNWTVQHVALVNPGDQTSADGAPVSLALQGNDADHDTLTYYASGLPAGLGINSSTGIITGTISTTAHASSPYNVTVTASDGPHSTSQTFLWQVLQVGVTNPGDQTNLEGDMVSLQVTATTPSGTGTLSYSASGLPSGLSINPSTGLISGNLPSGSYSNSLYVVTVAASNGTLSSSQTFNRTVNPRVSLTRPDDQTNVEGNTVSLQVQASEAGATLMYIAANLPPGLGINSSTGLISGTISSGASSGSPYLATVTVSDGTYSTSAIFIWTVTHSSNISPVLTNPGMKADADGDTVSLALTASDADNDPLTFFASGLPDGLSLNPRTGLISGTIATDAVNSSTPYVVTVTVDDGNGGTASQTFNWLVVDSKLSAQASSFSATEGMGAYGVTVATFTDTDISRQWSDYTATITWADGSSDQGGVDGSAGSFTVSGDHTYAHPGSFTVTVNIVDSAGTQVTASTTESVATASLTGSGGLTVNAVKGVPTTATLMTFTDANPGDAAGTYMATINWGDGSPATSGSVSGSNGLFSVTGTHTYANRGPYTATVTVSDADNTQASTTSTVSVGDVSAGIKSNLSIASFTSTDPNAVASNFTATINWGDGSPTDTNVLVSGSNGVFMISGSHTFATNNTYTVQVTVTAPNSNLLTTSSTVVVVPAPDTTYASEIAATAGVAFSGVALGYFTDPNTNDVASQFSVTISWGDGTADSSGTVSGAAGFFTLLSGSHTYANAGLYQARATILQAAQVLTAILLQANVAQAPGQQVTVSFNPTPIIAGYILKNGKPVQGKDALKTTVTAKINDPKQMDGVTFKILNNEWGGVGVVDDDVEAKPDAKKGIFTIEIQGDLATNPKVISRKGEPLAKPLPITIEALDKNDKVLGKAPIIVVIPKSAGPGILPKKGQTSVKMIVTAQNKALNNGTAPALPQVIAPKGQLTSIWGAFLPVNVYDQYGVLLDQIYNGQPVTEGGVPINVTVSKGQYKDFTGSRVSGGVVDLSTDKGKKAAADWATQPPKAVFLPPLYLKKGETQNIPVEVGGHSLKPAIVNRTFVMTQILDPNGKWIDRTMANYVLTWPDTKR
jgi:hypothetical protein